MMRASCKLLSFAAALLLAACSSSSTPSSGDDDDTTQATDAGVDSGPAKVDAGTDSGPSTVDAGTDSGSSSGKALGETCAADADCESDVCFLGGNQSFCSLHCTSANAAQVCTPPTFDGTCNTKGFCRKP